MKQTKKEEIKKLGRIKYGHFNDKHETVFESIQDERPSVFEVCDPFDLVDQIGNMVKTIMLHIKNNNFRFIK